MMRKEKWTKDDDQCLSAWKNCFLFLVGYLPKNISTFSICSVPTVLLEKLMYDVRTLFLSSTVSCVRKRKKISLKWENFLFYIYMYTLVWLQINESSLLENFMNFFFCISVHFHGYFKINCPPSEKCWIS